MQDVPKIVRERLQAATPVANHLSPSHPDAGALTAFAEQSLPGRERAVVLEHLAHCVDCRDIVALALPATEPVEPATRAPERGWLTWPALRWGLVATGVVAIASVGIVRYQRRPEKMASYAPARVDVAVNQPANRIAEQTPDQSANQAKDKELAPPATYGMAKKAENRPSPPASALANSVNADDSNNYDKKSASRAMAPQVPTAQPRSETLRGTAPLVGGALPHGPRLANSWQQSQQDAVQNQNQVSTAAASSPFEKQQAAGDLTANLSVPAPSEPVEVETQSAQTKGKNSDAALKVLPAAPQRQNEEYASARIGKAKPVVAAQTASGGAVAAAARAQSNASPIGGPLLASSTTPPRWTISSTGTLQRSFDQGFTWQVVDVNAPPAYFLDATAVQTSEKTSRAKTTKDSGKAFKLNDSSPIFRAVAATGADVWAGGSGGALYHSPDAGNHWTRIMPTSSGAALAGDIVSLEFPDTQHGKVSTSTGDVWTTSDGGQTWQKQ
jgi:hypothetical protein